LAEQFPEGRALFRKLEEEELQHASRVRLLAARYRHDPRLVDRVSSSAAELQVVLADSEAVLECIRCRGFARTLSEALVNLAAMEERLARAHAELIAQEAHPALREFFVQLAEQDSGHRALLEGGPAAREAFP
jgi:sulfur transfer complex TusBCD TusB component (DsrH family)